MTKHGEKPIKGQVSGLISLGESVTWQARHLGKNRILQVKIVAMESPFSFVDEQVAGDFKKLKHEHFFKPCDNGTIMIDQFYYEAPYGFVGGLVNNIYLQSYMTRLLDQRNLVIKKTAESDAWKMYLK